MICRCVVAWFVVQTYSIYLIIDHTTFNMQCDQSWLAITALAFTHSPAGHHRLGLAHQRQRKRVTAVAVGGFGGLARH